LQKNKQICEQASGPLCAATGSYKASCQTAVSQRAGQSVRPPQMTCCWSCMCLLGPTPQLLSDHTPFLLFTCRRPGH